jgi:lipid II:glycine glycyltransferase (peptidoglycan interpeptide bridge formation enzyme)
MAIVSVEDNIKQLQRQIVELSQEVHRMEGMLRVFVEFQKNGLNDLPGALPKEQEQEEEVIESA